MQARIHLQARNCGIFAGSARLDAVAMRQSFLIHATSRRLAWIGLTAIIWGCRQPPAPAENVPAAAAPEAHVPANGDARTGTVGAAARGGQVLGPDEHGRSPDKSIAAPAAATAALSVSETARLDTVMTPELVFPADAQRKLYRARPPEVKDGKRSYAFELLDQPGMVAGQHFHSITFAFAPAGTLRHAAGSQPEIMSAGGPQGSFVRASARSADGAFDVSVMERMLLPNTLPRPEIRADTALAAVLQRLERASAP